MNKLIPLLLASLLLSTGCKTTTGAYDPVRSAQVVAALKVPIQESVTRIIRNSPEHSDEIANYFRSIGNVACKMELTGLFTPEQLLTEIDKVTGPLQSKVPPLAITIKNTAVALFTIFYAERLRAELPPDKWPAHVAKLLCGAIDGGLKDAGKPGTEMIP